MKAKILPATHSCYPDTTSGLDSITFTTLLIFGAYERGALPDPLNQCGKYSKIRATEVYISLRFPLPPPRMALSGSSRLGRSARNIFASQLNAYLEMQTPGFAPISLGKCGRDSCSCQHNHGPPAKDDTEASAALDLSQAGEADASQH